MARKKEPEYCTMQEFADLHGVPNCTVRQWIHRKQIPVIKENGKNMIPVDTKIAYHRPWMSQKRMLNAQKNVCKNVCKSEKYANPRLKK